MFLRPAYSQVIITNPYPVQTQPLTLGLDTSLLNVELQFQQACPNATVKVAMPLAVQYVTGSVSAISSKISSGFTITDGNIVNLRSPLFNITAKCGNHKVYHKTYCRLRHYRLRKTIKVQGNCLTNPVV